MYHIEEPNRSRCAYPREDERNYVAALLHAISVILNTLSLIHLNWFRIYGTTCSPHLALYQFLRLGYFESTTRENTRQLPNGELITSSISSVKIEFHTGNEVLQCVTPDVLNLMRILVMLSLLGIFCSMVGFCLDMIGPTKKSLRFVRRNGLPGVWAVLSIIAVVGVSYLVSNALEYTIHELLMTQRFRISYDYGLYTLTAAGVVSLLATAFNLLQDCMMEIVDSHPPERLVEDYDASETFYVGMRNLPPPPPYSP